LTFEQLRAAALGEPFASKAQQGLLFAKHPAVAKEFAAKTPKSAYKHLPEHVSDKKEANVATAAAALMRAGTQRIPVKHKLRDTIEENEEEVKAIPVAREADRGKDGKLLKDHHTVAAREHLLAASISLNNGDTENARDRLQRARIHLSHSQHPQAQPTLGLIDDADNHIAAGREHLGAEKISECYNNLPGEPTSPLLKQKKRESEPLGGCVRERLVIHPHFLEAEFDEKKRDFNVLIITDGMGNKRDKHYYPPSTVREAVNDLIFEGGQAFADHPSRQEDIDRPERSIRDLIGYYHGSKFAEVEIKGKQVAAYRALLHVNEGCDWALGLIREAIEYQKKFPDKTFVGISINADGDTMPYTIDGVEVNKVARITEAFSADVVTKPARGGRFLEDHGGRRKSLEVSNLKTKAKAVLDAAAEIETLSEAESIDPDRLRSLAKSLTEAATAKEAKDGQGGEADQSEIKEGDVPPQLQKYVKGKGGKGAAAADADENEMTEAEKAAKVAEAEKAKVAEAEAKAAKEAASKGSGNLTEAELRTLFPSLYAAAANELRETVGKDMVKLQEEVVTLRAQNALRESITIAQRKLQESKLPAASFDRIMDDLIGRTPAEMDRVIESHAKYLGVTAGTRVEGAGARVQVRESESKANQSVIMAGVVEGD
jgi:hypothetical protein